MIFGYGANRGANRGTLPKRSLLVALGVIAIPLSMHMQGPAAPLPVLAKPSATPQDPRVKRLHGFLAKLKCPIAGMAENFVKVADANHLDWRLLPSIAVIESGGGKAYKNNNIFGWNSGEQAFESIQSGLELVAYKLSHSPLYRRLDSPGKLHMYNPNEEYADSVLAVMSRISPNETLRPVSSVSPVNPRKQLQLTDF